jgi:hypothetical protein
MRYSFSLFFGILTVASDIRVTGGRKNALDQKSLRGKHHANCTLCVSEVNEKCAFAITPRLPLSRLNCKGGPIHLIDA